MQHFNKIQDIKDISYSYQKTLYGALSSHACLRFLYTKVKKGCKEDSGSTKNARKVLLKKEKINRQIRRRYEKKDEKLRYKRQTQQRANKQPRKLFLQFLISLLYSYLTPIESWVYYGP